MSERGEAALRPGERVGRYQLAQRLGKGGMGRVYLAHDPELDRDVALKLLGSADADSGTRRRMLREAKAMAMLQHPNVATVYDVGTHLGYVYITMEYVDGWTVHDWIRKQRPAWRDVVDVFLQAGRGMLAAHHAGLVHRDFKPANVLLGRDGRTRVSDFGLARRDRAPLPTGALSQQLDEATPSWDSSIVGTPAYMAPEQQLGQPIDARSDQFSFCVALWESLYRKRPFDAVTPYAMLTQIVEGRIGAVPPGTEVPERIRQLLERGLAADPDHRFPSFEPLLLALEEVVRDDVPAQSQAAPPSTTSLPQRYEVEQLFCGGALGRVFRAVDRVTKRTVAIRQARLDRALDASGQQPQRRHALELAFRDLLTLRHPGLVSVLDVGLDMRREPYLVMALGDDARPFLTAARGVGLQTQVELIAQILRALRYLHGRGRVHGDIHSSSVVVSKHGAQLLFTDSLLPAWRRSKTAWAYVAPEVLMGKDASEVGDVYSVGALAFTLWSGRPPVSGKSWEDVTDELLTKAPDDASLSVSGELKSWVLGMLHKRPEGRIVSAEDALALLREASRVEIDDLPAASLDLALRHAPLFGKGDALARITAMLDRCFENKQTCRALVRGPSGIGKSRLLAELAGVAASRGAAVFRSRAEPEPGGSFPAWRPLMALACGADHAAAKTSAAETRGRIREDLERFIEDAAQPVVVLLDDHQWARPEDTRLMGMLAPRECPFAIIAAQEPDDEPPGAALYEIIVDLAPLEKNAVERWCNHALGLGQTTDAQVRRVHEASEGLPLAMVEILHWLAISPSSHLAGQSLADLLRRRGEQLPPELAAVTATAATAGRHIDRTLLMRAHPEADLDGWTSRAVTAGIVEPRAGGHRFVHDAHRRALLQSTAPEERCAAHARVAAALREAIPTDPERIAHHDGEAGLEREALEQLALAAERALHVDAGHSMVLCRTALSSPEGEGSSRGRLLSLLGQAAFSEGQLSVAHDAFAGALRALGHPLPTTRLGTLWLACRGLVRLLFRPQHRRRRIPDHRRAVESEAALAAELACRSHVAAGSSLAALFTASLALGLSDAARRAASLPTAVVAFALGTYVRPWAQRGFAAAEARASSATTDRGQAEPAIVRACFDGCTGELDRALSHIRGAAQRADKTDDPELSLRAHCIQARIEHLRGDVEQQLRIMTGAQSLALDDPNRVAMLSIGLASALHASGNDDAAAVLLGEAAAKAQQCYPIDRAALWAELAVNAARRGDHSSAAPWIEQCGGALDTIALAAWIGQPLDAMGEALVLGWRQGSSASLRNAARAHVRRWTKWGARYRVGRAAALLYAGRVAWLDGAHLRARRRLSAALDEAERRGLRLVRALAHLELSCTTEDDDVRVEHRESASRLVATSGAKIKSALLEVELP